MSEDENKGILKESKGGKPDSLFQAFLLSFKNTKNQNFETFFFYLNYDPSITY